LLARMKWDRPKLYGLILEHMSVESKDEVAQEADYKVWHKATDLEKLCQAIVKSHNVDCVSKVSQVKELTLKRRTSRSSKGRSNPYSNSASASGRPIEVIKTLWLRPIL
jgi:D-ribose pyranose/furanose isomerase RbsD